jgi:hypothetical protein
MPEPLTKEDLPHAGKDRWWRVTFNPRSNVKPILVELMEMHVPGRKAMSTVIGWEKTIASAKSIAQVADLVLARVADYQLVIGEYGGDAKDKETKK